VFKVKVTAMAQISVSICLGGIFLTAEAFGTKLYLVMGHHQSLCDLKK